MTNILPLELIDKCIGSQVWILMREERELTGVLRGFDDYFNLVLDQAVEINYGTEIKIDSILLNGTHICAMIPGGIPTD